MARHIGPPHIMRATVYRIHRTPAAQATPSHGVAVTTTHAKPLELRPEGATGGGQAREEGHRAQAHGGELNAVGGGRGAGAVDVKGVHLVEGGETSDRAKLSHRTDRPKRRRQGGEVDVEGMETQG